MRQLLLVTPHRSRLDDIAAAIQDLGGDIQWALSGRQAMEIIGQQGVDLVLTDEWLGDMTGLAFVKQVIAVNPSINCATVSSLSEAAFHEASEGLGIVMQLPHAPSQADGERLMAHLNQIVGVKAKTNPSRLR